MIILHQGESSEIVVMVEKIHWFQEQGNGSTIVVFGGSQNFVTVKETSQQIIELIEAVS